MSNTNNIIFKSACQQMPYGIIILNERYDGKGYPDGLKANQIPLEARIIAIADSYDAMTTDRPYRNALTPRTALKDINSNLGSQFDPELEEMFLKLCNNGIID
ncbi:MAG: PAS/PAC sensor protein [Candidatus Frackibacter sp. T328-2]|nr:MAG: PAS/PAC sensor protein [Candidatus Frackibacter sp. T328-2]